MEQINSRIRAMFDLIGHNLNSLGRQLLPDTSKSKTKASQSATHTSNQSASQTSRKSQERREQARVAAQVPQLSNVFAPHLMPATSLPSDRPFLDQHLLSVNAIVTERNHCAVYLIHCADHNRVAVSKPSNQQALWMPFTPIPPSKSWEEAGLAGLLIVLSEANMDLFLSFKQQHPFAKMHLMQVFEVELPHTLQVITRLLWYVRLEQRLTPNTHFKCCQDNEMLHWIGVHDIIEQDPTVLEHLWGNELLEMMTIVNASYKSGQSPWSTFDQCSLDKAFKHVPRNPPMNNEQQLLVSANLTEKDVGRLYADYLDHCFPCTAMTQHSFKVYMTRYGMAYTDERQWAYFRAFNFNNNGVISFPELLMGLACIDSKSVHNETRAKFVVRYYDVFKRGYLTEDDLRLMVHDMHTGQDVTEEALETKLTEMLRGLETEVDSQSSKVQVHQRKFLAGIGNHKVRGTSKLCRIGKPICALISTAIFVRARKRDSKLKRQLCNVVEQQYVGTCVGCTRKRPVLDNTLVKFIASGYFEKHGKMLLPDDSNTAIASKPKTKSREGKSSKSKEKTQAGTLKTTPSMESITQDTTIAVSDEAVMVASNLLKLIQNFGSHISDTRNSGGLLANNKSERKMLLEQLEVIEVALAPLLKQHRCVPVASPAIIIGDIHGNLADLMSLEKSLWKRFPLAGPNLVFLGDIVDRGKWSVECAAYVMCLIVIAPSKVTLLRGNHEVRELQCHYTYRQECLIKYGDDRIWQLTNRIFDLLPLCAVIDEAIFCAHGGIPRSVTNLKDLATMPAELSNPQQESQIAWEILWSDPMAQPVFVEMAQLMHVDIGRCKGFLPNRKRGTAWSFNEEALDRFLATNGLTHMVRAHEVPNNGFFFHFDKKCATIFSCSHYCGNPNECAILFVDRNKLRVIRVDTKNNPSATD